MQLLVKRDFKSSVVFLDSRLNHQQTGSVVGIKFDNSEGILSEDHAAKSFSISTKTDYNQPSQNQAVSDRAFSLQTSHETPDVVNNHLQNDLQSSSDGVMRKIHTGIPVEVLRLVFKYLDRRSLCKVGSVCRDWLEVSRSPAFWTRLEFADVHLSEEVLMISEFCYQNE